MTESSPTQRPVLLVVDGDEADRRRIETELTNRYADDYQIVCDDTATAGLTTLRAVQRAGQQVALVLAACQLPEMSGADFLDQARPDHPTVRRALLVAGGEWRDRAIADSIIRAIARGQADYYVLRPWQHPDEQFHVAITGFLYDWSRDHPSLPEVRLVGERWSPRTHEVLDLLQRNGVWHAFYPVDSPEGQALLTECGLTADRLPVVRYLDGRVLVDPSTAELADAFGAHGWLEAGGATTFDLIVIGAGPAGLAATVNGASEGLRTLVVEREAIGGQAASSSLIRNYLGFPRGVSGVELARSGYLQAWAFGAVYRFGRKATDLRRHGAEIVVSLSDGSEVAGRAVLIATGVAYRRLGVPGLEGLTGRGVYYGGAAAEAPSVEGQPVCVVGGANSAGQSALYLARFAERVTLLVRGDSLATDMSDYLIQQIEATGNIEVRLQTEVVGGGGRGRLDHLALADRATDRTTTVPARGLFILIGAEPHTAWLPAAIARDERGYLFTPWNPPPDPASLSHWPLPRAPLPLETTMPGVFAAGDVRYGAVKRVAAAIGEGSAAIRFVHDYLQTNV